MATETVEKVTRSRKNGSKPSSIDPSESFVPGIHLYSLERLRSGTARERDNEFYYLSFRLRDDFITQYRDRAVKWGFSVGGGNTLGEISWITKYARRKEDGSIERWYEGCRRVIEGMYSIQKDHATTYRLPWSEDTAHTSAEEAYDRLFNMKWTPPGRGLWMMGTFFVNGKRDSSALQNCAFISSEKIDEGDPSFPFVRLMEMSALGVGVGFDTLGAGKIQLHQPVENGNTPYLIGDSREGWCESVAMVLRSYFLPNQHVPKFDYSAIRRAGAPIRGFGGKAAGPTPLIRLHERLRKLLGYRKGEWITSSDIVDIFNMEGKCIVAANVRSSAEIALGKPDDNDFLDLKNWEVNPERMGADGWGYTSNNSIISSVGGDYSHLVERIKMNGEPGLVWLDVCQQYGRLTDPANNRDYRVRGVNPCGEQPLESAEACTLVETFPFNCRNLQDYLRTLKFAYLYAKTVTLLPTHWVETNEVMIRNRRIGTSMTGLAQFVEKYGWGELRQWQDAGYKELHRWDTIYSEWLGVRESIKVTTVKPSGTVSLVAGATPGCHWPTERSQYLRRMRLTVGDPVAEAMRDAGFPIEPNVMNPEFGVVVTCPAQGPDIRPERDVTVWEKVALAALCQEWWSDNAVSVTASFLREGEGDQIAALLRVYDGKLKSLSFLPMDDSPGAFPQMPYEKVDSGTWQTMRDEIKPLNWDRLYAGEAWDAVGEKFCTTDVCDLKAETQ